MRQGIHLGPRLPGAGTATKVLVGLLAAAAIVQGWIYLRALEARHELLARVRLEEGRVGSEAARLSAVGEAGRGAAYKLRSIEASGVLDSVPPTHALRLLESSLTSGMLLDGLSLKASPPRPGLVVDASAMRSEDVTDFEERVRESDMVASTRLLEERRLPDGRLAVRLQVDLRVEAP